MRHEMLTQHADVMAKKGYTESAFRDVCRTSSGSPLLE
jgi:hypothetical protein